MDNINDPENTIIMEVKDGTVLIELLPDIAPLHCERMKTLVRSGLYDNVCFHRVIEGFMAQTGDVQYGNMESNFDIRMAGRGGSEFPDVKAEFSIRSLFTVTILATDLDLSWDPIPVTTTSSNAVLLSRDTLTVDDVPTVIDWLVYPT